MTCYFRSLTGVLIATACAALALTGCAGAPAAPAAATPAPEANAGPAQPKVNRLVMALEPTPSESNELRMVSGTNITVFRPMYDYPISMDLKTGRLSPWLASAWSLEPDNLSYRVKLKSGVQFHHGWGEYTAKDLVEMWKDIASPGALHGNTTYWRGAVADVQVVNDYELIYHLTKADGQFLTALSDTQAGMEVRSKAQFDKEGRPAKLSQAQDGTGPYQFVAREQSAYMRFERTANPHWSGVRPDFPEFEFRFMKEPSTRLAALLSGEAQMAALPEDLMQQANTRTMKTLRGVFPGTRAYVTPYCCYMKDDNNPAAGWVYPDSPLLDPKVRQALNKAVNRDEMNKAFFGGKGELMYNNHFHPSRDGWDPAWQAKFQANYGYDLPAAKKLLEEAGYGPGKPLRTTLDLQPVSGIAAGNDIAEAIAGYWRTAGVTVDLVTVDSAEFTRLNRELKYQNDWVVRGTGSNPWVGVTLHTSNLYNKNGGAGAAGLNDALLKLTAAMDPTKRDDLWRNLGNVLFDNYLYVNLFWLPAEVEVNPAIVAGWSFPGSLTGTWSHFQNIRAAR